MNWSYEGPYQLSAETTIEKVRVVDGRAYVLAGAFATRYEWFVMDLEDMGHRGYVLVSRGGEIGARHRGCYPFRRNLDPGDAGIGYVAEKFPSLALKEAEELAVVMLPFLTGIFEMDQDFPPSVKAWRPE